MSIWINAVYYNLLKIPMETIENLLKIREAGNADAHQLALVGGKIFRETFLNTMPATDLNLYIQNAFSEETISNEINDRANKFILAFIDDELLDTQN